MSLSLYRKYRSQTFDELIELGVMLKEAKIMKFSTFYFDSNI